MNVEKKKRPKLMRQANIEEEEENGGLDNVYSDNNSANPLLNSKSVSNYYSLQESDWDNTLENEALDEIFDTEDISGLNSISCGAEIIIKSEAIGGVPSVVELNQVQKKKNQWEEGQAKQDEFLTLPGVLDMDAETEYRCDNEAFPSTIEQLFKNLDDLKHWSNPTETDMAFLFIQFETLSGIYKKSRINSKFRSELAFKEHKLSQTAMDEVCLSWKQNIQKLRSNSGRFHEILFDMESSVAELEICSNTLFSTAKNAGHADSETRVYKMIDIMVIYANLMNDLHDSNNEERIAIRKLLSEYQIPFSNKRCHGKLGDTNNNTKNHALADDFNGLFDENRCSIEVNEEEEIKTKSLGELTELRETEKATLQLEIKLHKRILKYVLQFYDVWQREIHWPWNWDPTWNGIKQGFSVSLMIIGFILIAGHIIPPSSTAAAT